MQHQSNRSLTTRARHNRPFVAWYLRERRLRRSTAVVIGESTDARVTESNQDRVTEDGQSRDTQ
jgi:hypothetical protein